jgi:DNA-binding response OmpR family regulator
MSRILVVEDTLEIAESLQQHLEDEGHEVALATKAAHALALATSHSPELIVLDLGLPDRDGFEVLEQLRGRGDLTPVLILSARVLETDKLRGFNLGADDYVTKPFGAAELMARIAALLRRARRPAATAAAVPADAAPARATALDDDALRERFGLTARQVDVVRLLGEGHTNAEIAERLGVSFYTVRTHTEHILAKLGVSSRAAVGALLYGA